MNSARFPGKMLAPFDGKPMIAQVVGRLAAAGLREHVVVVTSIEATDDPLARYVGSDLGLPVYRGDLDNVVRRFQDASAAHPAEWIVRICGDSPVIDGNLVIALLGHAGEGIDLVSNVVRRTFPAGQSVECVRAACLRSLDTGALADDEKEHATLHFYRHASAYRIRSVVCADPALASQRHVVDSIDDLRALENLVRTAPQTLRNLGELAVIEA